MAPTAAEAGMVMSHATTTRCATLHRTAEARRAAPTPTTQPVIVWVVDTGMPSELAEHGDRPARRGAEALMMRQFGDLGAHRLDDLPPARQRAQTNGRVAGNHHPRRHMEGRAQQPCE
jgi:hypothetical protein